MTAIKEWMDAIPEPYRQWVIGGVVIVVAAFVALVLHALVYFIAWRLAKKTSAVADSSAIRRTRAPARFVFMLIAVRLAMPALSLEEAAFDATRHVVAVALIAALTWLAIRAVSVIDDVILARYDVDVSDNLRARSVHTQTKVLTRVATVVIGTIGIAAVLMTFPAIRQFGASLLASAGIAGLVLGLAARPTLGNLIAGIQLAVTQPIRLDDVVIVEGEWGRIEEITSTYVVVKVWDDRRLVVPLQHFIEQPFQNWTRRTADMTGTVFIHADYTVPVDEVRSALKRIVREHEKWDKRICVLQVTSATERTVELRALVSARDAGGAWDLRCHVREKLIEFLQSNHPECLPRARADVRWPEHAEPAPASS